MKRILVVDDDGAVRSTLRVWLEREGFEVVIAADGSSSIAIIESSRIDLVIIDIFMPGMGGLETIEALHRSAPEVPIVAISGFMFSHSFGAAPDFLGMAAKVGVAYCLHKPFRPHQLMTVVEACLGHPSLPVSQAAVA
jgi:CheY-like chemotaxis protein